MNCRPACLPFNLLAHRLGLLSIVAVGGLVLPASKASADFIFMPLNASQITLDAGGGEVWTYERSPFTSSPTTSFSRTHIFSPFAPAGNTLSIRDFDAFGFDVDSSTSTTWVADYTFRFTDLDGAHEYTGTIASDPAGDFQGDFSVAPIALQYVRRVELAIDLTSGQFQPSNLEVRMFGSSVSIVPEPSTLAFLALTSVLAIVRPRRSRSHAGGSAADSGALGA